MKILCNLAGFYVLLAHCNQTTTYETKGKGAGESKWGMEVWKTRMGNLKKVSCKLENLVDLEGKYMQGTRKIQETDIFK